MLVSKLDVTKTCGLKISAPLLLGWALRRKSNVDIFESGNRNDERRCSFGKYSGRDSDPVGTWYHIVYLESAICTDSGFAENTLG
jgi:hypothetical protein